jgi:competence protein ComGF
MDDKINLLMKDCIRDAVEDLFKRLLVKNSSYGGSAFTIDFKLVDIDSRANISQNEIRILIRIEDKINRIIRGSSFEDENDLMDLQGYITLLYAVRKFNIKVDITSEVKQ